MKPSIFESSRTQLAWAISQLPIIEAEITAYLDRNPFRTFIEPYHRDRTLKALKVELTEMIPGNIEAHVGATLNALRASLDYLAVALAKRNGATKLSDVYFPIAKSETLFIGDGNGTTDALKKIKRLSDIDRNIIINLRPYKGGNNYLYLLNALNNGGKHVDLVATGSAPAILMYSSPTGYMEIRPEGPERLNSKTPINTVLSFSGSKPGADIKLSFSVLINHTEVFTPPIDLKVVPLLGQFVRVVETTLQAFEEP